MSYNRHPPARPAAPKPQSDISSSSTADGRHERIVKANAEKYREQVNLINKMRDREIERAMQGPL